MAENTTESAPVETPDESTPETDVETEIDSTGQEEESPTSEENESSSEDESDAESDTAKNDSGKKDSEARASETAKKLAIENRQLKREIKKINERLDLSQPENKSLQPPVRPRIEDYYQYDDFQERYDKALVEYDAKLEQYAIEKNNREQQAKSQAEALEKQQQETKNKWNKRLAETLKRDPDFNDKEAYEDVSPAPLVEGFLTQCPIGPDVLRHLHLNPDLAEEINGIKNPYDQVEKLIEIRNTLSNQIKGIKPKAPTSKPIEEIRGRGAGPRVRKSAEDVLYQ